MRWASRAGRAEMRVTRKLRYQIDWHSHGQSHVFFTEDADAAISVYNGLKVLAAHGLIAYPPDAYEYYPQIDETDWETPEWAD